MTDFNTHNNAYIGNAAADKIAAFHILILGAGAVGSLLADNLARMGFGITALDFDKIEAHNAGTQLYGKTESGKSKVLALRARIFQATKQQIDILEVELTADNYKRIVKKIRQPIDLVVDCFDNRTAREISREVARTLNKPLLHVGLAADYGEAVWDERYLMPPDTTAPDVCDYPLARNTVMLAIPMASQVILEFVISDSKSSWSFALNDFYFARK